MLSVQLCIPTDILRLRTLGNNDKLCSCNTLFKCFIEKENYITSALVMMATTLSRQEQTPVKTLSKRKKNTFFVKKQLSVCSYGKHHIEKWPHYKFHRWLLQGL